MRRFIFLSVGALFLSGCAIPLPLKIASWALDGLSMVATQNRLQITAFLFLLKKTVQYGEVLLRASSVETPYLAIQWLPKMLQNYQRNRD